MVPARLRQVMDSRAKGMLLQPFCPHLFWPLLVGQAVPRCPFSLIVPAGPVLSGGLEEQICWVPS